MKPLLYEEFKEFYEKIKLNKHNGLRDKRKSLQTHLEKKLPEFLENKGINGVTKTNMRFIDQGSYKINTTIKPKKIENEDISLDRDVALFLPIDVNEYTDSLVIRKYIKEVLEMEDKRTVKIKEPCITITYFKENDEIYHIDFPIYGKDKNDLIYLARGKGNVGSWEISEPDKLNDWFLEYPNALSEKDLKESQKRRIIRYLKKWKQEVFNLKSLTPPSIGITILVCNNFVYKSKNDYCDDLAALDETILSILENFELECELPVEPKSDVFSKLKEHDNNMSNFISELKKFHFNIIEARNMENDHEAAKFIRESLGMDFKILKKEAIDAKLNIKDENKFA